MNKKIVYDFSKLKGKIREIYKYDKDFCKVLRISPTTFIGRMKCDTYFSSDEIEIIAKLLNIQESEYQDYFFKKNVQ